MHNIIITIFICMSGDSFASRFAPHFVQNASSSFSSLPHARQNLVVIFVPHFVQNISLFFVSIWNLHFGQISVFIFYISD